MNVNVFLAGVGILVIAAAAAVAVSPRALDWVGSVLRARAAGLRAARVAYRVEFERKLARCEYRDAALAAQPMGEFLPPGQVGGTINGYQFTPPGPHPLRTTKKAAGRLLDGREYTGMPEVALEKGEETSNSADSGGHAPSDGDGPRF